VRFAGNSAGNFISRDDTAFMTGEAGKWMVDYKFTHKNWEIFSVQSGGNFADNRRR